MRRQALFCTEAVVVLVVMHYARRVSASKIPPRKCTAFPHLMAPEVAHFVEPETRDTQRRGSVAVAPPPGLRTMTRFCCFRLAKLLSLLLLPFEFVKQLIEKGHCRRDRDVDSRKKQQRLAVSSTLSRAWSPLTARSLAYCRSQR